MQAQTVAALAECEMAANANLFSKLLKWAHRQDENFVTESFAYMLNYWLDHDGALGCELVRWLCFGGSGGDQLDLSALTVRTQVTTDEGRPDIWLESRDFFAIIEVKKGSGPGETQAVRYRRLVARCAAGRHTRFVFLTVMRVEFDQNQPQPDRCVSWDEVGRWLHQHKSGNPVLQFLAGEFREFLQEEVMAVERVEWDYLRGMKNFRRLVEMLSKAIEDAQVPRGQRSAGQDFNGWYLRGKDFWVGIIYDRPGEIRFSFSERKPDYAKLKEHGVAQWIDGEPKFLLNVDSESVHFFARETDSQLAVLREFIHNSYTVADACSSTPP